MPIVECVPNFSEGRNRGVIDRIAAAISGSEGAHLLDVDPGAATNRTVITFVGGPDACVNAAFEAIRTAADLIDMRAHTGAHARMGATDVCPFIPVQDITIEECAELARRLGKRVAGELGIPVYLYEHAATRPERRNLADIRSGEYEGLAEKLRDPAWAPDFGAAAFNAKSGATVIGARTFLIAYNVNLNTRDKKAAHDIALAIREAGRAKRDAAGAILRDADGKALKVPGRLPATKAVGWYIEEYARAQVSINLVDYRTTGPQDAFDAIDDEARAKGLRVTGSELVGLIPLDAMLRAGRHYLKRQGASCGIPERQIVETAIQSLGLTEIAAFDPDEKIIEYRLARDRKGLVDLTVRGFLDELSTNSPAPGGGSVAALCGALSAALSTMVANLTVGRKGQEDVWARLGDVAEAGQALKDWYAGAVDRDTGAFNRVMDAVRMKGGTPAEMEAKNAALRDANRGATTVPLDVLEKTAGLLAIARETAETGNPNSLSDAGVAGLTALAAAEGAWYNVLINLQGLEGDDAWRDEARARGQAAVESARGKAAELSAAIESRLRG